MSQPVKSTQELYDLFITNLQDFAPELTDKLEGSLNDTLGGVFSLSAGELTRLIQDQFKKTFFDLADGPEVTQGPDDLQTLAVDHFGSTFARPAASKMTDTVTFSRATNTAGEIPIIAGTVVKTKADANGNIQRYVTDSDATMTNDSSSTDLSVTVNITAVVAGTASNAAAGAINVIESSLADKTIVVSNVGSSNGTDASSDTVYRTLIKNLIAALAGATAKAVEAKAKTVAGVVTATAVEQALNVIQYDVATGDTVGTFFRLPVPTLYIADSSGTAGVTLINAVQAAINSVRACGIIPQVKSATAVTLSWTSSITLNPSGPNYTTLAADPQQIIDSMTDYINNLPVGTSFVRATANAYILAMWGSAGTNDLTAFTTSVPSGDVTATATQKFIAGTVSVV